MLSRFTAYPSELKQLFMESFEEQMAIMTNSRSSDMEQVKQSAHKIGGSAMVLGLFEIHELCNDICQGKGWEEPLADLEALRMQLRALL